MSNNVSLSDRMKMYEEVTRGKLPPRTYTLIRADGRSFSNFTKKFKRPFDDDFVNMMNQTAIALCEEIQGCKIGYVQSDEISIIMTDFDNDNTSSWFDDVVQKVCSNSASIATESFNKEFYIWLIKNKIQLGEDGNVYDIIQLIQNSKGARFDSRVFTISSPTDVINYLVWRQQDASRNSVSAVAQFYYPHKQLEGKNNSDKQEMIFQKGDNWDKYPVGVKRGRTIIRNGDGKWVIDEPPRFSKETWDYLTNIIPNYK